MDEVPAEETLLWSRALLLLLANFIISMLIMIIARVIMVMIDNCDRNNGNGND